MTSFKVEIKVIDRATPAIQRCVARTSPDRLQQAVGPRLVKFVGDYVAALGPNKKHWPTTHFYPRAARATKWVPSEDGLVIRINQVGMRQRFHGGPIFPVVAPALTIPVSPISYGHSVSEFPGMFAFPTLHGTYLVQVSSRLVRRPRPVRLVRAFGPPSYRRVAVLNFLFRLSLGVWQVGNPNVLPTDEALCKEMLAALNDAIKN